VYLGDDLAGDVHAVEDGDVDNDGHAAVVDRLGAVGPHVWALCQVYVTGAQAEQNKGRNTGY